MNGKPLDSIVIAEWPKNAREVIRVELSTYNGAQLIQIRTWYRADDDGLRPGRSGYAVSIKHLPDIANAFAAAVDVAKSKGLIKDEDRG